MPQPSAPGPPPGLYWMLVSMTTPSPGRRDAEAAPVGGRPFPGGDIPQNRSILARWARIASPLPA